MNKKGSPQNILLKFLLNHLVYGSVGGMFFGILLLAGDVAGLKTMIFTSPDWHIFLIMLFFGLLLTFGSIAMAVGIMQLGEERD